MSLRRSSSTMTNPPSIRRSTPKCVGYTPFAVLNVRNGEIVSNARLSVEGQCHNFLEYSNSDRISTTSRADNAMDGTPPQQLWGVDEGSWKAFVDLAPGINHLEFELHHAGGVLGTHKLAVIYQPPPESIPLPDSDDES